MARAWQRGGSVGVDTVLGCCVDGKVHGGGADALHEGEGGRGGRGSIRGSDESAIVHEASERCEEEAVAVAASGGAAIPGVGEELRGGGEGQWRGEGALAWTATRPVAALAGGGGLTTLDGSGGGRGGLGHGGGEVGATGVGGGAALTRALAAGAELAGGRRGRRVGVGDGCRQGRADRSLRRG